MYPDCIEVTRLVSLKTICREIYESVANTTGDTTVDKCECEVVRRNNTPEFSSRKVLYRNLCVN
jgi:hypothetical protein